MRRSKFTIEFNKRYGDKVKDRKKSTLATYFKIPIKLLDTIFDRGLAAARNTGMRPGVTSPSQWARARLTKFILNVEDVRGGKAINKGRGQDGDIVELAVNKNNNRGQDSPFWARRSKGLYIDVLKGKPILFSRQKGTRQSQGRIPGEAQRRQFK